MRVFIDTHEYHDPTGHLAILVREFDGTALAEDDRDRHAIWQFDGRFVVPLEITNAQ